MKISVDLDSADDALTLRTDVFMLVLRARAADLLQLEAAPTAQWADRRSLAIGTTSTSGRAFWCAGSAPGTVTLLVGQDDETWDIAVELPGAVVAEILTLAREAIDRLETRS